MTETTPTKTTLLTEMHTARAELDTVLAHVGESRMSRLNVCGTWSTRDIVAHLIFWLNTAHAELDAVLHGTPIPKIPRQPGESWGQLMDRVNADSVARYADLPTTTIRADFNQAFGALVAVVESLSEAQLNQPAAPDSDELVWQMVGPNAHEHFREHIAQIDDWLGDQTELGHARPLKP